MLLIKYQISATKEGYANITTYCALCVLVTHCTAWILKEMETAGIKFYLSSFHRCDYLMD